MYPQASESFSRHSENLAEVVRDMTQIERVHKNAIRASDLPSELALRRVHLLLLAVFAEARLRKIIDDPTGFTDAERHDIWRKTSQEQRWVEAVTLAARRHYGVHDVRTELPSPARERILTIINLLRGELAPVITDRNKLAHGQWIWQLKSGSDEDFVGTPRNLLYNYSALVARHAAIENIGRLVHVLCVSEPTFDRDFASIMIAISNALHELDGHGYDQFATELRRRHQVGLAKRFGSAR